MNGWFIDWLKAAGLVLGAYTAVVLFIAWVCS
jgi:hypothetical protein